jgi:cytochrome c-type biogenesis protein CcsB
MSRDARKASALNQVGEQADQLAFLVGDEPNFPAMSLVPPGKDQPANAPWHPLLTYAAAIDDTPVPGFDLKTLKPALVDVAQLMAAWRVQDAPTVNAQAAQLAADLPLIRPELYPSLFKRQAEVTYNRLSKLTIPGAIMYTLAFVFFLMGLRSGVPWLRRCGLGLMIGALLIHSGGIAIRWWLVGDVFPPIKNEFESVMFSAFFGAVVGLILELRTRKLGGLFGAAASFVGMLAMLALYAAPYVAGRDIGGEIAPVNGVLMSYWLYIHVTMVTASYALIAMGFVLSAWWMIDYYRAYGTLSPSAWRSKSNERLTQLSEGGSGSVKAEYRPVEITGGAAAVGFWPTLARLVFPGSRGARDSGAVSATRSLAPSTTQLLGALDQCNLVVLQLAFCMLGMGIVFGAIWADQSWGRPWGWDPKETFALVTWIVYMIVVHVRVATTDKAWWTAALGIVGFFIMLFNWIGVNFWLVGLHSYA